MPTGSDPSASTASDRFGRSLVRWASVAVILALFVAGLTAFMVDRSRGQQSTDSRFSAVPSAASTATTSSGAPSPTVAAQAVASAAAGSPSPALAAPDTSSATATPATAPSQTPTAEPTPLPPRVALSADAVGIGETLAVRIFAPEAGSGAVVADGSSYPLLAEPGGFLFGVVGIPLNAVLGVGELALTLRDDLGMVIEERTVPFEVTTVERPIDFLTLTAEQGSVLTPEASVRESILRAEQFVSFDRQRRWTGLFRVPVVGIPTTDFGQGRSINDGPVGGFHSGADIANAAGTPIQAAAAGRVAWVGEMPIRGQTVILDHGGGVKTGYHHMQAILVEVGQDVSAGTVVGEMGSSGLSTGPHLHWELTIYGVNVDPMTWTTTDFTN